MPFSQYGTAAESLQRYDCAKAIDNLQLPALAEKLEILKIHHRDLEDVERPFLPAWWTTVVMESVFSLETGFARLAKSA